ncbi:MAG: DsbA family protein [Pseudomonadota bacterium]
MLTTARAGAIALAAFGLLSAPACSKAPAEPQEKSPDLTQEQVEEIVRTYILEHPEVILQSVNAYAERQELEAAERLNAEAKARLSTLLSDQDGVVVGAADADVAVVEFFDYHCGYCKAASPVIRELIDKDESVKVVFRELPILKEESETAARYALAAREQGKYLDFHFALMNASGTLTEKRLAEIAKQAGLDAKKLASSVAESEAHKASLQRTYELAQAMGVSGTPAIVVASADGEFVQAFSGWTEPGLRAAIEAAKTAAKS